MLLAVELYCHAALRAIEIQDVIPHAVLAAKLLAGDLRPLQTSPERGFGRRQGMSQFFASLFQDSLIVDWLHVCLPPDFSCQ
jgi:hypothetical protein